MRESKLKWYISFILSKGINNFIVSYADNVTILSHRVK